MTAPHVNHTHCKDLDDPRTLRSRPTKGAQHPNGGDFWHGASRAPQSLRPLCPPTRVRNQSERLVSTRALRRSAAEYVTTTDLQPSGGPLAAHR
ncbi:hypothetical protein TNCT_541801 [Trichonephila clavata]|uniref:Uncharacterized protein n=1 Tax=Trichonephila clavata TaxID=2740835 RepID=A0A8X6IL11_TRICU|nr:hypothetical protein TNCT_541801 [Trichonephila clavata]